MYSSELENHKYFDEMQKYIERVDTPFKVKIKKESQNYRDILDKIYNFYIFSCYLADYFKKKDLYAIGAQNSLNILNCKSSLNLFGIYNCLKTGLEQEASIILRSLYESYVTIFFILQKDAGLRMKLYYNFSKVERRNNIIANEEFLKRGLIDSLSISDSDKEFYIKDYEKVKDDYHPKYPYEWAWKIFMKDEKSRNPSLNNLCKELGEDYEVEYTEMFSVHSLSVHGGSILEDAFSVENTGMNIIATTPKFTQSTLSIGALSISYYSKILLRHLDYFKVDDYESIKEYIELYALDSLYTKL